MNNDLLLLQASIDGAGLKAFAETLRAGKVHLEEPVLLQVFEDKSILFYHGAFTLSYELKTVNTTIKQIPRTIQIPFYFLWTINKASPDDVLFQADENGIQIKTNLSSYSKREQRFDLSKVAFTSNLPEIESISPPLYRYSKHSMQQALGCSAFQASDGYQKQDLCGTYLVIKDDGSGLTGFASNGICLCSVARDRACADFAKGAVCLPGAVAFAAYTFVKAASQDEVSLSLTTPIGEIALTAGTFLRWNIPDSQFPSGVGRLFTESYDRLEFQFSIFYRALSSFKITRRQIDNSHKVKWEVNGGALTISFISKDDNFSMEESIPFTCSSSEPVQFPTLGVNLGYIKEFCQKIRRLYRTKALAGKPLYLTHQHDSISPIKLTFDVFEFVLMPIILR